ncbi:MAG: hypothetical protein V3R94_07210 [Acidobacteriota bacterium]
MKTAHLLRPPVFWKDREDDISFSADIRMASAFTRHFLTINLGSKPALKDRSSPVDKGNTPLTNNPVVLPLLKKVKMTWLPQLAATVNSS